MDAVKLKNKQLRLIKEIVDVEKNRCGTRKANQIQILYDQIINIQKQLKDESRNQY